MIEAKGLVKRYGRLTALDNVSFRIESGELAGLLGPNGAGKTTTMRILTGFMPPTAGEVRVGGIDLLEEPRRAKAKIGYLPETPPLYPELTVLETLRFVAGFYSIDSVSERIDEILEQTGLAAVRQRLVGNLSKGYRQRVGIAQALLHKPDVLVLDEPMNGLDPRQIIEFRDLLRTLKVGRGILLSSHILQEVTSICDRVMIMNQGRIVGERRLEGMSTDELEGLYLDAVAH